MANVVQIGIEKAGRSGYDLNRVNAKLRELAAEGKQVVPESVQFVESGLGAYAVAFAWVEPEE